MECENTIQEYNLKSSIDTKVLMKKEKKEKYKWMKGQTNIHAIIGSFWFGTNESYLINKWIAKHSLISHIKSFNKCRNYLLLSLALSNSMSILCFFLLFATNDRNLLFKFHF